MGINQVELVSHLVNLNRVIVRICNHIPGFHEPGPYDAYLEAKEAGTHLSRAWQMSTSRTLNTSMAEILDERVYLHV